jgi:hypothetical protein
VPRSPAFPEYKNDGDFLGYVLAVAFRMVVLNRDSLVYPGDHILACTRLAAVR